MRVETDWGVVLSAVAGGVQYSTVQYTVQYTAGLSLRSAAEGGTTEQSMLTVRTVGRVN